MAGEGPLTFGTTVSLSATTTTGRVAVSLPDGQQLVLTNLGPDLVYVKIGDVTVNAVVATSFPILPGTAIAVSASTGTIYVAGITPTSTATLKVSSVDGALYGYGGGVGAAGGENVTIVGPLGQAVMASSIPVVLASNQSSIPVAATEADGANVALGALADAAASAGGTGSVSAKLRRISTQLPAVVGSTTPALGMPVTPADQYSEYETVAASQTAQVLGATGATGDYVTGLLCTPATTSPGVVTLLDNAISIPLFVGGASSVSNLVPFFISLGAFSVSGAWKVTTGANISVMAFGNFT